MDIITLFSLETTYLSSLAADPSDHETLYICWTCMIPCHHLILIQKVFDMLTHGHFNLLWPCVKQSRTAIHFSTNDIILKTMVMVICLHCKNALDIFELFEYNEVGYLHDLWVLTQLNYGYLQLHIRFWPMYWKNIRFVWSTIANYKDCHFKVS